MRLVAGLIAAVLLVVGVLGMGFGVWALVEAVSLPTPDGRAMGLLGALTIGALPFLAGTVALAGAGAIFATLDTGTEIVAELRAMHLLASQEAKRAAKERASGLAP